eukprot:520879_1
MDHILCIIIYCDWTDLQSDFSNTFRISQFETMKALKKCNSKYYYLSKCLIECVVDFGINGEGYVVENKWKPRDLGNEKPSPFFCGLSVVLNIPLFATYLSGPCSTSKNITVAMNFAQRDGMIMQLINNEDLCSIQNYFDCSWISNYSEENERLFMFTRCRLK